MCLLRVRVFTRCVRGAQVPLPSNLNLDKWINSPPSSSDEDADGDGDFFSFGLSMDRALPGLPFGDDAVGAGASAAAGVHVDNDEQRLKRRTERMESVASNPYHLGFGSSPALRQAEPTAADITAIPIQVRAHCVAVVVVVWPPCGVLCIGEFAWQRLAR